jgi:hypothetical protein
MEEAMLVALVKAGQIADDAMVREEAEGSWQPIAGTHFVARPKAKPPSLPSVQAEKAPKPKTRSDPNNITAGQGLLAVLALVAVAIAFLFVTNAPKGDSGPPPPLPAAPAAAPVEESPAVVGAPFLAKVDANWATFDGLPKPQRTKDRFRATLDEQNTLIDQVPESARPLVADHMMKLARQHISSWSSVGASFAGDDARDLVPSANKAACQLWGSMWVNDVDTLSAIMTLGFQRIVCSTKTWVLKDEASACYLWSVDTDDNSKSPAFVWSTLELYQRSLVVGKRTDDDGPMAYMALMSKGREVTVMPGTKAAILDTGEGWFHVAGDNFSGYVAAELCHHTATK